MEIDACILLPSLFFTILAIVLAAKFIPKKQPDEKKKKAEVSTGDDIPPSRALAPAVEVPKGEPKVEVPLEFIVPASIREPVTVAPVIEKAVEDTLQEPEIIHEPEFIHMVQAVPEPRSPFLSSSPNLNLYLRWRRSLSENPPQSQRGKPPQSQRGKPPQSQRGKPPQSQRGKPPQSQRGKPPQSQRGKPPQSQRGKPPQSQLEATPEPAREATPEPAREATPEPAREPTEGAIFVPELNVTQSNDVASDEEVQFTPGMKISKLEKLITKTDMVEEQRIVLTSDFTSL
ncbi:hypothetical protein UPYG_G00107370 [Umbra pygmaea]|uniref:Matrix-remodeling-associated protein 7 n=1 Tax=Umbra pygmaea TaxID=75934 RepID=A0ABD0X256_UMBPY